MKNLACLSLGFACFGLPACTNSSVGMEVVYRSNQCNIVQPGLVPLRNRSQFEQAIINDAPFAPQSNTVTPSYSVFQEKHVVLIAMGQKPTAGYGMQIEDESPRLEGDTLFLPIVYEDPDGVAQAQVVTSPCMVVSVDKGAYREIRVNDVGLPL